MPNSPYSRSGRERLNSICIRQWDRSERAENKKYEKNSTSRAFALWNNVPTNGRIHPVTIDPCASTADDLLKHTRP